MEKNLKKSPLHNEHVRLNAKFTEFAGWTLPLEFEGTLKEHRKVRETVGVFDVSHMGEIIVEGPDAVRYADFLVTNDVIHLKPGQARYTPMCNEEGGILDDLIVYKLATEKVMLVVNAANVDKDFHWIESHTSDFDVKVHDASENFALIAFQGPKVEELLQPLSSVKLSRIPYYSFTHGRISGIPCMISRTGYTGEDGFEFYVNPDAAVVLWRRLYDTVKASGGALCGLGARDTLRLEAGYLLYGNDMDESVTPLEAGLSWTVKFEKGAFMGREAILIRKEKGVEKRLKGLVVEGKGIPRSGDLVVVSGEEIGTVTSGNFSPALGKSVALAYVKKEYAKEGTAVEIVTKKKRLKAEIVRPPFYRGSVKSH